MPIGTDYNVKQDLIDAVVAKVFKNNKFAITGEGLQKALCDMIESLWDTPAGGDTTIVSTTYATLASTVTAGTLVPGAWYKFTYENVHSIVDSTLANTQVPGYSSITETLLVFAPDASSLSGFALSEENPYDIIEYDVTQSNHGAPSITDNGSIVRRYDIKNDVEAYFDFRNHTVARFPINIAAMPDTTIVDRGGIIKETVNSKILMSVRDDSPKTNYRLVDEISDIAENQAYYAYNSGNMEIFSNTIPFTNVATYFPAFNTSGTDVHTGIKLGKGVTNVLISNGSGYSASNQKGCTNVKIENNSSAITVSNSDNISIGENSTNILIRNSNDISIGEKNDDVIIFDSEIAEIGKNNSEILLLDSDSTEIKHSSNDILILRSNYTEVGTKCSSIFVIRHSHKNVFGNSCGAISLGSSTANDFKSSCTDIDIYSGGYNRFAQGCNVINLLGERDEAYIDPDNDTAYYSPYSEMAYNTFGIACSNISFSGTTGGRGNMFGDECANLVFGGLSTGTGEVAGPALMNTSFCRGVRNKTFKDYPLKILLLETELHIQ